jgi:hypothetical protein
MLDEKKLLCNSLTKFVKEKETHENLIYEIKNRKYKLAPKKRRRIRRKLPNQKTRKIEALIN